MKSLKILLIQPSYQECVQTLFGIYNTDEGIGYKPPIGLLYIATSLRQHTEHQVDILDCQLDNVHHGNLLQFMAGPYDVVGLSAWTDYWYQTLAMAREVKRHFPQTLVVMGGPHVNLFPSEVLSLGPVDAVVLGDGERPMVELTRALARGELEDRSIPGVYLRGRNYPDFQPYVETDLDSLPLPDRNLLPQQRYSSVISPRDYVTTMVTSRGCPFHCVYCKLQYQKPMRRSAQSVIAEFQAIADLGIKEVEVYDDTFNWDHRRTIEICRGITERGLDLRWAIRDRVSQIREDVLTELERAGCYRIHLGIETGSDRMMKAIRKGITVEQARRAVELIKRHKFVLLTYYMYGLPGETMPEARQTLKLALELDSDYAEFSVMIPYPGTKSYLEALQQGVIPYDYWREYALSPTPSFQIPYVLENLMSRQELVALQNESVRRFYFRPRYILRQLARLNSWQEFKRKAAMGLGLLQLLLDIRKR